MKLIQILIILGLCNSVFSQNLEEKLKDISNTQKEIIDSYTLFKTQQQKELDNNLEEMNALKAIKDSLNQEEFKKQSGRISVLEDNYAKLTVRLELIEKEQKLQAAQQQLIKESNEKRKLAENHLLKSRYEAALHIIMNTEDELGDLLAMYEWGIALNSVSSISNPTKYPTFKSTIEDLRKNQKKKFQLPKLNLTNPILSTAYSFICGLSNNNNEETKEKIQELNCVLEFSIKAGNIMEIINLEGVYLKSLTKKAKEKSKKIKQESLDLVGLGNIKILHSGYVKSNIDPKFQDKAFLEKNKNKLEELMNNIISMYNEYRTIVRISTGTLDKVELALNELIIKCNEELITDFVMEQKKSITDKVQAAKTTLNTANNTNLPIYKVTNSSLPIAYN